MGFIVLVLAIAIGVYLALHVLPWLIPAIGDYFLLVGGLVISVVANNWKFVLFICVIVGGLVFISYYFRAGIERIDQRVTKAEERCNTFVERHLVLVLMVISGCIGAILAVQWAFDALSK